MQSSQTQPLSRDSMPLVRSNGHQLLDASPKGSACCATHFKLRGELFQQHDSALDVYKPIFRNRNKQVARNDHSSPKKLSVEHLDITTIWRGLKISQAFEVHFWESIFKCSLEDLIEEALVAHFYDAFPENQLGNTGTFLCDIHMLTPRRGRRPIGR